MLNSFASASACAAASAELFNARPIVLALRCSIRIWFVVHRSLAVVRTDNSGRGTAAVPRADSLCPPPPPPLARLERRRDRVLCVCLHALSSFQRTDISERPERSAHARVAVDSCLPSLAAGLADRVQGNLPRLLSLPSLVNPFFLRLASESGASELAQQMSSCVGKCRLKNLAVFPGTKKARCLDFSANSPLPLQRVSHAERLESMAYKN
jgi:hypothetical protein